MKNRNVLEKFSEELLTHGVADRTFAQICRSIGERTYIVDRCVRSAFGVSGKVVTESVRLGIPIPLLLTPAFASLIR